MYLVNHRVLRGHCLTRYEAARVAGMTGEELRTLAGVIRIEGRYGSEEAYPEIQFADEGGFIPGLPGLVAQLYRVFNGAGIAGWVSGSHPALGGMSVIDWLLAGRPWSAVEPLLPEPSAVAA